MHLMRNVIKAINEIIQIAINLNIYWIHIKILTIIAIAFSNEDKIYFK